jgi:cyclopropane-fatty-acyl-phospholipid synthase
MNGLSTSKPLLLSVKKNSLLDRLAKPLVMHLLKRLRHGRLVIRDGKEASVFGEEGDLCAQITVRDTAFYRKVLFGGSIGAGEAYVDHLWDVDDLTTLARIMVLNMDVLENMERGFGRLLQVIQLLGHLGRANTRQGAKRNILAHYDLGNDLYKAFLDPTMMYSSAIYPTAASSLEEASRHKLEVICNKLQLQKDDRVVEIGSGWGGFAIHAASNYGCHVTTTTISDAQYQEARERIAAAGLSDRITLLHSDYRDLSGTYDKLVSVEMIEAVGRNYLPAFFEKCCSLLRDNGTMLLQAITLRDYKYEQYKNSVDFIQRHIFPGGHVPSLTAMQSLLTKNTDLVVRSVEDFGLHYARTLEEWRLRFLKAFPQLRQIGYDERFRRLWEYYLCYCEGGFRERSISVVHLVATRPGHRPNR